MLDLYAIKGNEVYHIGKFYRTKEELLKIYSDFTDNGWELEFIFRQESEEVI